MRTCYKSVLALVLPLLLAGCLLVPGKFDSHLRLMNDGTYSFTYTGQMQMADDDNPANPEAGMTDAQPDQEQKNAAVRSVFGGAVPGDDEGLKKFAAQLAKYDGWKRVEYMGDNLFEVEYAVSGDFDRMLAFPTIPGATMQFPFVQIVRRSGGEIEVLTPAMAGPGGLAGAMGPLPVGGPNKEQAHPIDGNFTIETDGEVLSNNSADGYAMAGLLKKLVWTVTNTTGAAGSPRAIIKLAR